MIMPVRDRKMLLLLLVSVLLSLSQRGSCSDESPVVKTPQGTYRGIVLQSRGGRDITAFKGVPYAKPPVGSLRFKEPVELEEREGIFDADQDKMCFQRASLSSDQFKGDEDCLYLNIYRPKDIGMDKKLPVYVWIHGGGFVVGSGGEKYAGPRYLLDNHRDLVMVSINYRLAILGFLSANDVNIPGNNGLKDQALALKWVKENIELFGGDPDSITIGGASAGAASVSHHLRSKTSRDLFHRAISHSGSGDCPWAIRPLEKAREMASNLISFLGCPFDPPHLLECLQSLPPQTLLESEKSLKVNNTGFIMYLSPVVEKDSPTAFMTKESVEEASDKPWISGVTSEEALLFYNLLLHKSDGYMDLSILNEDYKSLLPTLAYYGPRQGDDAISGKIIDHYFGEEGFSMATVKNFIELLSDRMFNGCYLTSASKHKGKLFLYNMGYRLDLPFNVLRPPGMEKDMSHGEDAFLYFDLDLELMPGVKLNQRDTKKSDQLVDFLYNFIAHGDPTPDTHSWEESAGQLRYLNITNQGNTMSSDNLIKDRVRFLQELDDEYKLSQY